MSSRSEDTAPVGVGGLGARRRGSSPSSWPAWSVLGSALGPVLVVRLFHWPLPSPVALTMMAVATATVVIWQVSGFDDDLFKMLPGMVAATPVYAGYLALRRARS